MEPTPTLASKSSTIDNTNMAAMRRTKMRFTVEALIVILATDPEVPGSIPGPTKFSEK
jgi:hypothetical protein